MSLIPNPIRLHLISMPNHNQNDIKDVEDSAEDIHPYEFIDLILELLLIHLKKNLLIFVVVLMININ